MTKSPRRHRARVVTSAQTGPARGVSSARVQVLGARLVPAVERDLKPRRDARHLAVTDLTRHKVRDGVGECRTVEALLRAVAGRVEPHRVQVNPPSRAAREFEPDREPVGLGHEPELPERVPGGGQRLGVNGQVKVAVVARALPVQGVDAPAAAEPVPNAGMVEGVEHRQHILGTHGLQGCHRRRDAGQWGFGPEAPPVLGITCTRQIPEFGECPDAASRLSRGYRRGVEC